eukprot:SAG31_NODE_2953_length_4866_cov_7.809104_3_plen_77_part_00
MAHLEYALCYGDYLLPAPADAAARPTEPRLLVYMARTSPMHSILKYSSYGPQYSCSIDDNKRLVPSSTAVLTGLVS